MRFFVPSRALADAKILLHLRDPRDVLTSMFFSYCFMHRGPVPANTGYRKEVADAGIDKFVLDMSSAAAAHYEGDYGTGGNYLKHIGNMAERYERYLSEVIGRPNALARFLRGDGARFSELASEGGLRASSWRRRRNLPDRVGAVCGKREAAERRHLFA